MVSDYYPHIASVQGVGESVYNQETGEYEAGSDTDPSQFTCRAEPASPSGYQKTADGARLDYSWTVYTKAKPDLKYGQRIVIMDGTREVCNDTVKQYSEGRFNTRIWL